MRKRRIGEYGDVHVYINEQADVAILTDARTRGGHVDGACGPAWRSRRPTAT